MQHPTDIRAFSRVTTRAVKPQTSIKLALAAIIVLFFAGFVLRAAMRLASTAMHSLFGMLVIVVLIVILFARGK